MSEPHDSAPHRRRAHVLDRARDHEFTWPQCEFCHAPLDFHSIEEDPTWFCGECGTV
jgi:hypothetical protein